MICLDCDNKEFLPKPNAAFKQEFRGETFSIEMPAMACSMCGWTTTSFDQAGQLRRLTADAYRKKHGLLTSDEIRAYRALLHKSQRAFAAFLGVGEASVKRWETWKVQGKCGDNWLRQKCNQALLEKLKTEAGERPDL